MINEDTYCRVLNLRWEPIFFSLLISTQSHNPNPAYIENPAISAPHRLLFTA